MDQGHPASDSDGRRQTENRRIGRVEEDVAGYLYVSGRCAVAHAYNEPLVDPDQPEHLERLQKDLPLIRALAEHFIEHQLGVKSRHTVWREHLYELEGFRPLLGAATLADLKQRKAVPLNSLPTFPNLSVRLKGKERYPALEGLRVSVVGVANGTVMVRGASVDQTTTVSLSLNFAEERLELDPESDIEVDRSGSPAALRAALDRLRFMKELLGNGVLEVWDADRNVLLGRCAPYIPENIDPIATFENIDRLAARLNAELNANS